MCRVEYERKERKTELIGEGTAENRRQVGRRDPCRATCRAT